MAEEAVKEYERLIGLAMATDTHEEWIKITEEAEKVWHTLSEDEQSELNLADFLPEQD